MMDYIKRYSELKAVFKLAEDVHLNDSGTDIRFFEFTSTENNPDNTLSESESINVIPENRKFVYPVFMPSGAKSFNKAILLLHGLNERSWNKYLTWAEFLSVETQRPVILFPIAYHMNRSPQWWANPRQLTDVVNLRKKTISDDPTVTFANVALSGRLSEKPDRFYRSGRQTFEDISSLLESIKSGRHEFLREDADIDIFSYSIGSFLSQILLMANPKKLLTNSKLFMFCGGSIFSSMSGASKMIMDKESFDKIQRYYLHTFGRESCSPWLHDEAFESFESMISPERKQNNRLSFFRNLGNRINGISLKRDIVIPYSGVKEALGDVCAEKRVNCLDFDTGYSHENPFPVNGNPEEINRSFLSVFRQAAGFFA